MCLPALSHVSSCTKSCLSLQCRDACGVVVSNTSGTPWKIVYSGDTRPCQVMSCVCFSACSSVCLSVRPIYSGETMRSLRKIIPPTHRTHRCAGYTTLSTADIVCMASVCLSFCLSVCLSVCLVS